MRYGMRLLLFLLWALAVDAQTTVYLRDTGHGFYITGATNATPIVIQTGGSHGLSAGDLIAVYNMVFDAGSGCGSATLDGRVKVKAVIDSTHFSIMDESNVDVPSHGAWCDGSGTTGQPPGIQYGGKVAPHTLVSGLKGWFDGDNGTYTRSLALGTNNGLTSLTVSGTTATVVTSFSNYINSGEQVSVWNSGSPPLDNSHNGYTVTVDSPTQFHFTVSSVSPGTYSNYNNACGPSATPGVFGTADCMRVSRIAITGNVWWDAVYTRSTLSSAPDGGCNLDNPAWQTHSCTALPNPGGGYGIPAYLHSVAIRFLVDQANQNALNSIRYWLTHIERTNGVNFAMPEDRQSYNDLDFFSYLVRDTAPLYAVGRAYLSSAEKQTFVDKMFSDIRYQSPACNKVLPYFNNAERATFSGTTVTGTLTRWVTNSDTNGRVTVGDAVYGNWGGTQYYVTAVNSDTSLTVIPADGSTVTTPFVPYLVHKWKNGDCGALWMQGHWPGATTQPSLYPVTGGSSTFSPYLTPHRVTPVTNNGYTYLAGAIMMGAAAADDDPRAITLLERAEQLFWDWGLPVQWGYNTGMERDGSGYAFARNLLHAPEGALALQNSVSGFPDLDMTGPWMSRMVMMKIYGLLPYSYNPNSSWATYWPFRFGSEAANDVIDPSFYPSQTTYWQTSWIMRTAPTSNEARYWRDFMTVKNLWGTNAIAGQNAGEAFSANGDPRTTRLDYTTLPKQILLQQTSQAKNVAYNTGYDARWRGDTTYSRTGWSNPSDTLAMFQARAFMGDHDVIEAGSLHVYKTGYLLGDGALPTMGFGNSEGIYQTWRDGILQFSEGNTTHGGVDGGDGIVPTPFIDRWSGGDAVYGDAQSRYVYARADVKDVYANPIDRAKVHFAHFKKAESEEIMLRYTDVDISSSPTAVRGQIHYPQNSEVAGSTQEAEGNTTCPGAGTGCVNFDSTRTVLTQENGVGSYTNGLITKIFSPSTVKVTWDGTNYFRNQGQHDYKVSICGGSACGATVSGMDWLEVHKVTSSLSDTTLTATALNPDANWTGVQTLDKVALFSRGAADRILVKFQTTHAGTAQYLIAGLDGGHTYRAYRWDLHSNTAVANVAQADNTFYFEGTAGTYWIFPSNLSNLIIGTPPALHKGRPMAQDFKTAGDGGAYVWSVSAGTLPPGVQLSPDGVLSGIPAELGEYTVTIRAALADDASVYAESTMTLTVEVPPLSITLTPGARVAVAAYGGAGMDATTPCVVEASESADFGAIADRVADSGGPGRRVTVLGASAPLREGTTYYVRATCGTAAATATLTTAAARPSVASTVAVMAAPPARLGVATMEAQFGSSAQLGSSVTESCSGACRVDATAISESVLYVRRVYRNAAGEIVAQSGITPVIAGRPPGS